MRRLVFTFSIMILLALLPLSSAQNLITYQGTYFPETTEADFSVEFGDEVMYVIVDNTGALTGDIEDRELVSFNLDVDTYDYGAGAPPAPPVDEVISTIGPGGGTPEYDRSVAAGEYHYEIINQTFAEGDTVRRIQADFESDEPATFFLTNSTGFEAYESMVADIDTSGLNFAFVVSTIPLVLIAIFVRNKRNL